MKARMLPLLLLLALGATANAEGLYKWVDSQGKVHYSDQPPADAKAQGQKLEIRNQPAASSGESPEQSLAEKVQASRKRKAEAEEAKQKQDKAAAETKQKQDNCIQATGHLRTLQQGTRLIRYNAAGEREYLDDAARQQAILDAQKAVDTWCK